MIMKHNKYIITAYQHDKTISAVINMQYALWLDCICKNNLDLIYIHNVKSLHDNVLQWCTQMKLLNSRTYPSSFNKTLSNAVNKRVTKVEKSPFIKVTKFIKKSTSLQITVAIHLLNLDWFLCNYTTIILSNLLWMREK